MIRWKQEQIHRERDARRTKIVALKHEAETLKKQLDRIEKTAPSSADLEKKYNETLQQLQKLETVENKKLTSDKLVTGFDKTVRRLLFFFLQFTLPLNFTVFAKREIMADRENNEKVQLLMSLFVT